MRAALRDTVRLERRRIATVRTTYLVVILALLAGGVIALMIALVSRPDQALSPARTAAALTAGGDSVPLSVVGGLLALVGVTSVGHDYRYGLLRAVLSVQPRRGVVVASRLIVLAVTSAWVALGVSAVGAGICSLLGRTPTVDTSIVRVVAAHTALSVLWSWLGAGLGWVLRSSAGALSLLLLGPLLVEPLLVVVAETEGSDEAKALLLWLPFAAARQALGRQWNATADTIGALAGGLVFAGVTALVLGIGWLLVQRRDV